jgi:hypothetical protein
MNFGYLLFVSTDKKIDYLKLAYALAISIKNTQKEGYDKVALVIDDASGIKKLKSSWVFDEVIEWNQETFWDGRAWMDQLTPWDHTVCLDADMLFLRDYSHWIDYFVEEDVDLYIPNRVYNYRNELVTSDYYRESFTKNQLPNLYSLYTFFKKDSLKNKEFFDLSRLMTKNQTYFTNNFLTNKKPRILGTDEAFSLSAKLLGISEEISYDLEFPKIVHMKPMIQGWPWPADDWTNHLGFYLDRGGNLKISNYKHDSIVHYVKKDIITDEVISMLEEILWEK